MFKIIKSVSLQDDPVIITSNFSMPDISTPVEEPEFDSPETTGMVGAAEAEANKIITDAKAKANACIEEANQQIEIITQQAATTGRQQGYEEGMQQGKQAALEQMQQGLNDAVAKAEHVLAMSDQEAKEMIASAERQVIDIAMAIARKILAREIEENPMAVLPIVKTALDKVRDQDQVVIRVNQEDFDMVLQAKQDLQKMIGREQGLRITADQAVDIGGCMIETPNGTVDARLDTQFAAVQQVLQGLLP
ncbi:MAG: FliH/SctL family protein [Veillonellales bacterium]